MLKVKINAAFEFDNEDREFECENGGYDTADDAVEMRYCLGDHTVIT